MFWVCLFKARLTSIPPFRDILVPRFSCPIDAEAFVSARPPSSSIRLLPALAAFGTADGGINVQQQTESKAYVGDVLDAADISCRAVCCSLLPQGTERRVLSSDPKTVKIWNRDDGTVLTNVETPSDINDVCVAHDARCARVCALVCGH